MLIAFLFIVILLLFFLYLFPVARVCGDSMSPTLNDGDIIIVLRITPFFNNFKEGDVFLFTPPEREDEGHKIVIKRLSMIVKDDKERMTFFFVGDNKPVSFDSRYYGFVDRSRVKFKMVKLLVRK